MHEDPTTQSPPDTAVEQITQDLACPQCDYNLRGLSGPVTQCPECGVQVDVAKLVAARWTKPWFQAPGFNTLLLPSSFAVIGGIAFLFPFTAVLLSTSTGPRMLFMLLLLGIGVLGLVWIVLLWIAKKSFGSYEGVLLALLAHGLFVGYAAGVLLILITVLYGFAASDPPNTILGGPMAWPIGLVLLAIGAALIWAARRGERFIAGRCIRQYLARHTIRKRSG